MRWYSFPGNAVKTNATDISDPLLAYTGDYFKGEVNGGLVSQCASHWGKVVKENYPWNHLGEINQVFGAIGKGVPEPAAFYIQHANRLKWAFL